MSAHIYYTSTAFTSVHPDNQNSKFRNSINFHSLSYLPENVLQASVASITFTLKQRNQSENFQLGLRSNIPDAFCIRNSFYDNIMYTFTLLPSLKTTVVYPIPASQFIYFNTTKERLCQASFEIIDLSTNQPFDLINGSIDPTLIEIIVRNQTMSSFQILLESSDSESLKIFPENHNMNFTIQLPERKELQNENWTCIAKAIQITGDIFNVQDSSFYIHYLQYFATMKDGQDVLIDLNSAMDINFSLPPNYYSSKRKVINYINERFRERNIKCSFSLNSVKSTLLSTLNFDSGKYIKEESAAVLTLSSNLSAMLGYTIERKEKIFDLINDPITNFYAKFDENLSIGTPANLFLQMDLLQYQLVGQRHLPILQLLNITRQQTKQSILHFNIRENNISLLKTKLFSKIGIKITDSEGNQIKAAPDRKTIIHLDFVNHS